MPQLDLIDPLFCRKLGLSLSQLFPEIIWPTVCILFQQNLQILPFDRVLKYVKYVFSLIFNPINSIFIVIGPF